MDYERLIALTRGGNDCCYVCGAEPVEPKPAQRPLILKCAQCRKLGTQALDQLDRILSTCRWALEAIAGYPDEPHSVALEKKKLEKAVARMRRWYDRRGVVCPYLD